jgi:hypothetical protein
MVSPVAGDTFPVGCAWPDKIVFSDDFRASGGTTSISTTNGGTESPAQVFGLPTKGLIF